MDINEDQFWKLLALGWNGKEELGNFFIKKYGVTVTKEKLDNTINKINLSYTEKGVNKVNSIASRTRSHPYLEALRLFRTVNGIVIGPSSKCFGQQNKDWT